MYKRITHITLLFAMTCISSNSALATIRYFSHKEEGTLQNGTAGTWYSVPITEPFLIKLWTKQGTLSPLDLEVYDGVSPIFIPYTQVNPNPLPINPGPAAIVPGPAAIIPGPAAVNPDPLTTSALSPEVSSLNKDLQILSELSKVDVASLTEDYSPEEIKSISNAIDDFYTTTLGEVTSPEKAVEISHIATQNNIDLKKYYNPSSIDSSDDAYANTLTPKEQSELYLATIHDIENRDDKAEGHPELVAKEGALDQSINRLEVYEELIQIATDTTNSRIMELVATDISSPIITTSSALPGTRDYTGVSAGNKEHNLNSVWMRGTYGGVWQGKNLKNSSFYGNTYGGTIGADGNITDDTLLGISYTRLYADFKYRIGLGNKARTISDIMSVYGVTKLNDKYTLQSLFTTGKTHVKQKTKRLIGINTYKTAFGEFDVNTYCAEAILNYKVPNDTYIIIPSLGFRYSRNYDSGYHEHVTGVHNFHVS